MNLAPEYNTVSQFTTGNVSTVVFSIEKSKTYNYLIKIDEEYKVIMKCVLKQPQLEQVIKTYYADCVIEITTLYLHKDSMGNKMLDMITEPNLFLTNNEICPKELQNKLTQFEESIVYFKDISDSKLEDAFATIKQNSKVKIDTTNAYNDVIQPYTIIENFNDSLLSTDKTCNIYFNNQFNNICIILHAEDFISNNEHIKVLFPEMQLLISAKLDDKQIETIAILHTDIFVDFEDALTKINEIINDNVVNSKLSISQITNLMKKHFTFSSNSKDCIKFTNVLKIINSQLKITDHYTRYMKRQLPFILVDLGLKKKRLADGIYWYGLIKKTTEVNLISDSDIVRNNTVL